MQNNWFECKVKYVKVGENGKESKITVSYLMDALTFTEAEARMTGKMEYIADGEFIITDESRSNITEVFPNKDGDRWFKAKTEYISVDENSGKESKTIVHMLVEAKTVKHAYECIEKELKDSVLPFETPSISESPIMDVFPFFDPKTGADVPANLKPIEKKSVKHLEVKTVIIPEYSPFDEYTIGEEVMVKGIECVITSNGVCATFRKKHL